MRTNPPIRRMSCSSALAWITDPALKNNKALNTAWLLKWNTPTDYSDRPQTMTIYPLWEQVL
jgi:hypothetical protein